MASYANKLSLQSFGWPTLSTAAEHLYIIKYMVYSIILISLSKGLLFKLQRVKEALGFGMSMVRTHQSFFTQQGGKFE